MVQSHATGCPKHFFLICETLEQQLPLTLTRTISFIEFSKLQQLLDERITKKAQEWKRLGYPSEGDHSNSLLSAMCTPSFRFVPVGRIL